MNAIRPVDPSPNQTLPSGPRVVKAGLLRVGVRKVVILPRGVICATWEPFERVNQKFPSAPSVISKAPLPLRIGNDFVRVCASAVPTDKPRSIAAPTSSEQKVERKATRPALAV